MGDDRKNKSNVEQDLKLLESVLFLEQEKKSSNLSGAEQSRAEQSRAERHGANELISSWRRRHGAPCRAEAGMKERRRRRAPHRYPLFSCCCFFLSSLCLSFFICCCCCRRRRRLRAGTRRPFGSWPKSVPDSRTSPFVLHLLLLLLLLLLKLSPLSFASQ